MTGARSRPRFILVDSSLSGSGGHYLEYAEQVFGAAQEAGFDCALVANTAFKPSADLRVAAFPVLPLDLWGHNLALRHDRDNRFTEADRRFLRLNFSRLGVLWAAANNPAAVRHYAREVPLSKSAARNMVALCRLAAPIQREYRAILSQEESDETATSHWEERTRRYDAMRAAIRVAARDPAAAPAGEADDAAIAGELYRDSARAESYARAVERVLDEIGTGDDDIVFIPTLSFAEATAVRSLLARSAAARRPVWCLLFRRDVYRGYTPDWDAQEWNMHAVRHLFASFLTVADRARIKLLCDTEELSRQYRQFQSGPVTTVAIPVRTRSGDATIWPAGGEQPVAEDRLEILYRRDARFEHGFDYLFQILDALPQEVLPRIRVSAAATASVPPIGTNDFGGTLSLARLRPYRADCYRQIDEPRLRLDGWRAVMGLFDIAVFVEPREARPSLFLDELDAAASAAGAIVLPGDTALAGAFGSSLARRNPDCRAFYYKEGGSSIETAENVAAAIAEAIQYRLQQSRPAARYDECWRLCYVGDAREEKGFSLLPAIYDRLALQVVKGRPVRLAVQAYQTGPTADVEMLKATDRLLRSTGDGNIVVPEPLPPDRYAAMIAASDIVFNLYKRTNYIARSSGIFVEAIACRKPVIVTAGTWMSALMGAHASAYHREMVAPGSVVSEVVLSGTDVRWREIGVEGGKHVDRELQAGDTARIADRLGIYHVFGRPDQANHIWLELAVDSSYPDICVHVTFAWRGANLTTIREERIVLNRLGAGPLSLVLEVPRVCEDLWVGLNLAHTPVSVTLSWLQVRWIAVGALASLPGGFIVSEAPLASMAEQAAAAITTMLANYDAYRASCDWLARRWADGQHAGQLVKELLDAPMLKPQTRFSGRDW